MKQLSPEQLFGMDRAGRPFVPKKKSVLADLLCDGFPIEYQKPYAIIEMLKKTKYAHIFPRQRLTTKPIYQ